MATTSRIAVMEGTLGEVSLADLLQVIGIGRQYTAVELRQQDQSHTATLFLKSGKLIAAAGPGARGKEAFFRLFPLPKATTFHVFRTETPTTMPEPIGAIGLLLVEALMRGDSATAEPTVKVASAPSASADPPPRAASQPVERPRSAPVAPIRGSGRPDAVAASRPSNPVAAERPSAPAQQMRSPGRPVAPPISARAPAPPRKVGERAKPPFVLGVVSPKGGCGKTTIALNLALALARQGHGVILVDADPNGDILSSIDARERARAGTFDVLAGKSNIDEALLSTVIPRFKIMPASGPAPFEMRLSALDDGEEWRKLIGALRARTDFVIVDAPSGMLGLTLPVVRQCTHVLGVLQAEVVAQRSFTMFAQGLEALPESARPAVLGVILNMVQPAHPASVGALQRACSALPREWLLETSIPRSSAFLDASEEGLPLRLLDEQSPPPVSFLFEMLAAELNERLDFAAPRKALRLLD